jgi:hypothetical protein
MPYGREAGCRASQTFVHTFAGFIMSWPGNNLACDFKRPLLAPYFLFKQSVPLLNIHVQAWAERYIVAYTHHDLIRRFRFRIPLWRTDSRLPASVYMCEFLARTTLEKVAHTYDSDPTKIHDFHFP